MLEAAGLPLPGRVWAHGFVHLGGERFSKSAGVKLDLGEAIDRFGPDAFRYYLLREIPWDSDGNFTWERFEERYTRRPRRRARQPRVALARDDPTYREGVVPRTAADTSLDAKGAEVAALYAAAMDALDLRRGAELMGELVTRCKPLHRADRALDPGQERRCGGTRHRTRRAGPLPRTPGGAVRPVHAGKECGIVGAAGWPGGRAIDGVGNSHGPCGRRVGGNKARGALSQAPICYVSTEIGLSRCSAKL